jgi:hypothetical protein
LFPFAFDGRHLREISIEDGNRHFKVDGDFVLDLECQSIRLYFGTGETVTIPNTIEELNAGCFYGCEHILNVVFEARSRLCRVKECAFASCSSLSSICIPSSVEELGGQCFYGCKSLSTITFESGSKLSSIGDWAFSSCSSLSSIYVPSSVERLGNECFSKCGSLSTITFESGSKLSSVGESPFSSCSSLSSICIPSSLQTILAEYQALLKVPAVTVVPDGDAIVNSPGFVDGGSVNVGQNE